MCEDRNSFLRLAQVGLCTYSPSGDYEPLNKRTWDGFSAADHKYQLRPTEVIAIKSFLSEARKSRGCAKKKVITSEHGSSMYTLTFSQI